MKTVVLAAALVAAALAPPVSASSPRSGELNITKECSKFDKRSFCSITSSNLRAIEVGTKIIYLQPDAVATPAGSDVVLDPPGHGKSVAFGNCSLAAGRCTFTGGTGKFKWFHADVAVTYLGGVDFAWAGTYSFSRED
jgi:hypothetical protein